MAKISVISDLHLGFGKGTEREEDPFVAAERTIEKIKELDSDVVLLAGDIFDTRLPRPEHWSRFMKMLSLLKDGKRAKITKLEGREDIPEEALRGIPLVAIHGTHERRGKGMKNSIKALEDAGFLIHLHCSSLELDIEGERLGIHGMSGVPEKYSKSVLKKWDPEPFEDAYNIFMLHQDLEQYIYNPVSPPELGLEDMPDNFDLYVSGHIHWKEKTEVKDKPFIIPGSLVPTQLKKKEAESSKGFYVIDTEDQSLDFVEVEPPRGFFYEEVEVNGEDLRKIERMVEEKLEDIVVKENEERSLVRIKVKGKLPKGINSSDLDLSDLKEKYNDAAILSISENLEEEGMEEKVQTLRDLREEKLSVDEMGMKMLRERVKEAGANMEPDEVFESLVNGDIEDALETMKEGMEREVEGEEEADGKSDGKTPETDSSTSGEWWKK